MSASSTLLAVLRAIEKQNKPKHVAALHPTYRGGKGPAPYVSTGKSVVQPKTSKQSHESPVAKGAHGFMDVVGNLASDVADTVQGLPGGVIKTIHDPVGTVKAVGKDYQRRYSPLVHGDFGKFFHEIEQHPLAPLLDAASVATGGGAAVGKIAQSARIAKVVERAGATATATRAAKVGAKLEKRVAPAKTKIANLEQKAAVVKVDRASAADRAAGVAHPDRVATATAPFQKKLSGLAKKKADEQTLLDKAQAGVAKPKSRMGQRKTDFQQKVTQHTDNISHIDSVIKNVTKDMRTAKKQASVVPVDIREAGAAAVVKHDATIASIQKQIAENSRRVTRAEAVAKGRLAGKVQVEGLPRMLARLQKVGEGGYRRIGADKGGAFKGIEVALHRNPVKRLRQNLGIDLQEHVIPQRTPLIGLESRAKKAANLQRDVGAGRTRAKQRVVRAAVDELEKVGKKTGKTGALVTAAQAIIDGVSPADYARLVKDTRSTGDSIQGSINKKMTQAEHHTQTDELVKPHLDKHAQELYVGVQQHFQREALAAGRQVDPVHLQRAPSKLIDSPEVRAIVNLQKAHEAAAHDAMEQLVKNKMLTHDEASAQAVLHVNLARAAKGQKQFTPAEAKAVYEKAGLPAPSYNPDTLTVGGAALRKGMLKESKGKLYSEGTRINNPMNIVMRHELASKATDLATAHKLMLSAARKIEAGHALPKGYIWIKDNVAPTADQQAALFKNQFEDGAKLGDDYFALLESEKRPRGGYAVRKDVADDLAAGRKAMSAARADGASRAVQAWKYLVLVRPAFLVHNVLSNQAMYHLKNGWDFRAFHDMQKAFKSGAFDEHHHSEGLTFSEDVAGKGKGKISKAVHIFYKLTAQHEHWLRQLTAYETARKMPQVQRELRALKGGKFNPADHGGRTMFHEAYNRAVAKAPHVRDLVTRNMDDTLGNYRYYTAQERMLKNISPFYGWERHSVRNMVRMMEDNPATMAMLTQIGMVGHDKWNKDFGPGMPAFVKNYVQDSYIQTVAQKLGIGDEVNMYDFNSTNPWSTALDVGKAATGDRDALIGLAGPLVTGPYEALSGKSALTGAPSQSRFDKYNVIAGAIDRVVTSTPPVATYDALTSQVNEKKKLIKTTDKGVVARQLGGDFRQLDKDLARKQQAAKTAPHDKYGHLIKKKKTKKVFN